MKVLKNDNQLSFSGHLPLPPPHLLTCYVMSCFDKPLLPPFSHNVIYGSSLKSTYNGLIFNKLCQVVVVVEQVIIIPPFDYVVLPQVVATVQNVYFQARQTGQDEAEKQRHLFQRLAVLLARGNAEALILNRLPTHPDPHIDGDQQLTFSSHYQFLNNYCK